MFCWICDPTVSNIRIFDPQFLPINLQQEASGLKNPYIQFRQITNQPAQQLCCYIPRRHGNFGSIEYKNCRETTRLMFCRICDPAASNIRIFDPRLIPINYNAQEASGLKNPYILFRQITNRPAQQLCCYIPRRHGNFGSIEYENCRETTRLMFCWICDPTASNIRIFDPQFLPIINYTQEAFGLKFRQH